MNANTIGIFTNGIIAMTTSKRDSTTPGTGIKNAIIATTIRLQSIGGITSIAISDGIIIAAASAIKERRGGRFRPLHPPMSCKPYSPFSRLNPQTMFFRPDWANAKEEIS